MNHWWERTLVLAGLLMGAASIVFAEEASRTALSPQEELNTFRLNDPDLLIELVAAEPQVDSPVAIAWDADGRMFVAEMSDYPIGPERGRIRLLEDRDGDGRYEHSQVFAADVPFPTSVLPSRQGVLVTAAPDILFFEDGNHDGVAENRTVLFTGFGEGNQQLRVNGLIGGADNWIYGANGRSDGEIRRPNELPDKAISIRGRDFRFRPDGSQFEAITGGSQFGLARDDWGERFCSWNTIPLRHVLLEQSVLQTQPQLIELACRNVADPTDSGRVFPISPQPQTFNQEPVGFYNALCGLTVFRGDALPQEYQGDAFVGESLYNVVHRRKLVSEGPSYVSKRAVADAEFLVASDPWFHPVYLATGPDGALYVADFYRRWVEHPQWVQNADAKQATDWREGASHGRIWRIRQRSPEQWSPQRSRLESLAAAELVNHLSSPNGWVRDTAQRLLVERQDRTAVPSLLDMVKTGVLPQSRLHALWTLDGLNSLASSSLLIALADTDAHVRRQAVRLAAAQTGLPELRAAMLQLANDPDAAVRFEVAIAIARLHGDDHAMAVERLAAHGETSLFDTAAIQIATGGSAWNFLQHLVSEKVQREGQLSVTQRQLMWSLARRVGSNRSPEEVDACIQLLAKIEAAASHDVALAVLSGFGKGLNEAGISFQQQRSKLSTSQPNVAVALTRLFNRARATVLSDSQSVEARVIAARALEFGANLSEVVDIAGLLKAGVPQDVASAVAEALARLADATVAEQLFAGWNTYSTATRRTLIMASLRSHQMIAALLSAVEADEIGPSEIDLSTHDLLQQLPNAELASRAKQLLGASTPIDRTQVLAAYASAIEQIGDRKHGAMLVSQHCLTCHQIQGRGRRLGPDLSGIGSHPKQQLLVSLLDPSRQVSPDYVAYTLVTTDGQVVSGLVVNETATAVIVRRADGTDEIVSRGQIEVLRATGKSLMPDGFEQKLSPREVSDVLEFLTHPDASLLTNEPPPRSETEER